MKHRHPLTVQWLALTALFGLVLFVLYHEQIVDYQYRPSHIAPHDWSDRQITGEITRGFLLEQPLNLTHTDLPRRERRHDFCASVLFSNYLNRRNRGHLSLTLSAGGRVQVQVLNARHVRDNVWQEVCFDEFSLDDVLGKPAMLVLAGIDGEPGRSVTAWLGTQPSMPTARLQGQDTGRALAFDTVVRAESEPFQHNAYVLMVIAAMVMAMMVLAFYQLGRRP
jgi:hypothetical protein